MASRCVCGRQTGRGELVRRFARRRSTRRRSSRESMLSAPVLSVRRTRAWAPLLLHVLLYCALGSDAELLDLVGQLQSLHELHRAGGLTSAEFATAKARVLAEPPLPPLPSKQQASFSVVDFGADPTGRNDSTQAINNAVAAASARAAEPCQPVFLCGLSIPTLYFPAGEYLISGPIQGDGTYGLSCNIHGDGHAIIRQLNSSSDIFFAPGLWRWKLSGLTLDGGANQLHIGNNNINTGFYEITDMAFSNASNTSIRTMPKTASTQITISRCEFMATQRVVVNYAMMAFLDSWVEVGCPRTSDPGASACVPGRAVFENHVGLTIERMIGVPIPGVGQEGMPGYDLRWIDNYCYLRCVDARFGGEGGGITIVVNKASFLEPVPPVGAKTLPEGTKLSRVPQASTIIFERCEIDSYGSARGVQPERRSCIWLEQIPSVLIVRDSAGFAYAPSFGPPTNFSLVKMDPSLIDGPQLAFAAQHERILTFDINEANNWYPLTFADLPEPMRPWVVPKVYGDRAPTSGHWRQNQFVTARPMTNATRPAIMGWLCIAAGQPGSWAPIMPQHNTTTDSSEQVARISQAPKM